MLQAPRIVRWTQPALLLTPVVGCLLLQRSSSLAPRVPRTVRKHRIAS